MKSLSVSDNFCGYFWKLIDFPDEKRFDDIGYILSKNIIKTILLFCCAERYQKQDVPITRNVLDNNFLVIRFVRK